MSLVGNERTKLLAAALDRVSTVCITVGIAAPVSSFVYSSNVPASSLIAACYIWLLIALGLHLAARRVLGRLE